jgi:hypothetical protein
MEGRIMNFFVGLIRTASVLLSLSLVACGGGSDPPDMTISGYPMDQAMAGYQYSFQPTVLNAAGPPVFTVAGKPAWASFDSKTGHLWGTPDEKEIGNRYAVSVSVTDGKQKRVLPGFAITILAAHKANYGHYFATNRDDTPRDAAKLCEQPGVTGIVWRRTWLEVEPSAGSYDFNSIDDVLGQVAASHNPHCQLWMLVEFKSFSDSPIKNPCPVYLQSKYSAPNYFGNGAATCFMWEPSVVSAYVGMMQAAAARFNGNPRVEGLVLQESSLGFGGASSQDMGHGGTYTPRAWRDALITLIDQCAAAFPASRCMAFLNFLRGNQSYLYDISAAISAVPFNQVCISGPDLLPDEPDLYEGPSSAYQVIVRHPGCRSNSAQNDSYNVPGCALECIYHFAVAGTLGAFPSTAPLNGGLCVNSYILWNDTPFRSATGLNWKDALPVIAAHPYGADWLAQCVGGNDPP